MAHHHRASAINPVLVRFTRPPFGTLMPQSGRAQSTKASGTSAASQAGHVTAPDQCCRDVRKSTIMRLEQGFATHEMEFNDQLTRCD